MRAVTYQTGAVECYVTTLTGTGGGLEANINRWCGQIGQEALTSEVIAALPRITMLGQEAVLVELAGDYSGMGDDAAAGSMLLGTVCELPGETVFVKMTGPEAAVRAEKESFLAFSKSIKAAGQ